MLVFVGAALASGYHFLKVEGLAGYDDAGRVSGGVGLGTWSDLLGAWLSFGDPGADGWALRQAWVDVGPWGPTIGVVPPAFADIVDPPRLPWLLPWTRARVGSDMDHHRYAQALVQQAWVLNPLAWAGSDPQVAYLGPTAGLGLQADWWRDWREVTDLHVMTGKLSARGGLAGGLTLRDTWYVQASALAGVDLFGIHQVELGLAGVTGFFFDRLGLPLGLELEGRWLAGDDNAAVTWGSSWETRAGLYWKLVPPHRTRLEEEVSRRAAERDSR